MIKNGIRIYFYSDILITLIVVTWCTIIKTPIIQKDPTYINSSSLTSSTDGIG